MNETRLRRRHNHRKPEGRVAWIEIQQLGKKETIAEVSLQIDMIADGFPIFVAIGDLASSGIDGHVERSGKCRSALDVTIANEPNDFALRKDGGFVVERAVAEVKGEARGHPIAVPHLDQIAAGDGLAVLRFEQQEAMKRALGPADGNRIGG